MIRNFVKIYRKLPFRPFKKLLSDLLRKHQLQNKNRIVISKIDGITYELDLNELIDSSIYYEGCFEATTTAIINKYIKRGMTVFDIGANIGCHTLHFAKLVSNEGIVIAFEPMLKAFSKLKRNLELNRFQNIVLEKIALSNTNSGKQPIYFQSSYPLGKGREEISKGQKEIVDIITLDEYVRTNKINRIDFIKLDVDGYEYKVIQGGINSIKKFKPIMIIEFGKYTLKECGDRLEDLIDLLDSLGFSFYSERNLRKYESKDSILNAVPSDRTINVLCKLNKI